MYRVSKSRLTQQLNKSIDADEGDRHDQTRLFTIDDGAVGDKGTRCTKYKIHRFYDKIRNNKYTLVDSYYEGFSKTKNADAEKKRAKKYPSGFNPFGSDEEDIKEEIQTVKVGIDESNKKKYPSGFNPFGSDDEDVIERNQNIEVGINESNKKKYPSGFNPFGSDDEDVIERNQNIEVGINESNKKKYPSGFNPFGSDDEDVIERNQNIEVGINESNKKKYPPGFNPFGSDDEDVKEGYQNVEFWKDESNEKKHPSGFNPFGSDDEDVKKENVWLVGNKEKKYPSGINPFGSDEEDVQEENMINEEVKKEQKYRSGLNPFGSNDDDVREGNVKTQSESLGEKNCRCILINSVKGELQEEEIKLKTEIQVRKKNKTHDVYDRDSETVQEENSGTPTEACRKDKEEIIFECVLKEKGELKYPTGLNPFDSDEDDFKQEVQTTALDKIKYMHSPCDNVEEEFQESKDVPAEKKNSYNPFTSDDDEVQEERINVKADTGDEEKCTYNPFDTYEVKAQTHELNAYDADNEDDDDDEDDDDYEMFGIMSVNGGDHQNYINTSINIDPTVYEDYTFGLLDIYARGQEDKPMNDLYENMVEEYDGFAYGLLGSSRHHIE